MTVKDNFPDADELPISLRLPETIFGDVVELSSGHDHTRLKVSVEIGSFDSSNQLRFVALVSRGPFSMKIPKQIRNKSRVDIRPGVVCAVRNGEKYVFSVLLTCDATQHDFFSDTSGYSVKLLNKKLEPLASCNPVNTRVIANRFFQQASFTLEDVDNHSAEIAFAGWFDSEERLIGKVNCFVE